jgi:hypothetical protein
MRHVSLPMWPNFRFLASATMTVLTRTSTLNAYTPNDPFLFQHLGLNNLTPIMLI